MSNSLEYKQFIINGTTYMFAPYTLSDETETKPITITWCNKGFGINLPPENGTKIVSYIWFRRNDQDNNIIYSSKDYAAVKEALRKLRNCPYDKKRFWLCPDSTGIQIWTSEGITVRFFNNQDGFIGILTKGRFGYYQIS